MISSGDCNCYWIVSIQQPKDETIAGLRVLPHQPVFPQLNKQESITTMLRVIATQLIPFFLIESRKPSISIPVRKERRTPKTIESSAKKWMLTSGLRWDVILIHYKGHYHPFRPSHWSTSPRAKLYTYITYNYSTPRNVMQTPLRAPTPQRASNFEVQLFQWA